MDQEWYLKTKDMDLQEQWIELYKQQKEQHDNVDNSIWLVNDDINKYATMTKEILPILFDDLNIKSVLDIGCSDAVWQGTMDWTDIKYTGFDIVSEIIEHNKVKYKDKNMKFENKNMVVDRCKYADLVMVRNVLLHLSLEDCRKLLTNIKNSDSKYILVSTDYVIAENKDTSCLWATRRNLNKKPFGFPFPKMLIPEIKLEYIPKRKTPNNYLGLWFCDQIPDWGYEYDFN